MAKTKDTRPSLDSIFKSPIQKEDLETSAREEAHKRFFEALRGAPGKDGKDGKDGEKGERGERGADGFDGIDGKDGERGPKGERGERGFVGEKGEPGEKGKDGRDGVDGRDGTLLKPEDIVSKINKSKVKINPSAIEGLSDALESQNKTIQDHARRYVQLGGPTSLLIKGGGVEVGRAPSLNFTGATITSNGQGDSATINVAIGGGTAVYNEIPTGSGTSFTLANTPTTGTLRLYANGQRLMPTTDYSLSGTTITTVSSWVSGTLMADYSH